MNVIKLSIKKEAKKAREAKNNAVILDSLVELQFRNALAKLKWEINEYGQCVPKEITWKNAPEEPFDIGEK